MKKVSIIVTTCNGEQHLAEQIDSLLAQTYPLHEIIVQDDGSTDGTLTMLQQYARQYPLIHVFHNEGEHGVNPNFYSALRRATGDLIAICDQDDIWEPQKIAEQVELMGDNLLVAGKTIPFSTDGSEISFDKRTPNCHVLRLLFASAVPGHAMMLRPELLDLYEPNQISCYDAHLQVVASALNRFHYQGICPIHWRRHVKATTYTKPIDNSRGLSNMLRYIMECIRLYPKARPTMLLRMQAWERLLQSVKTDTDDLKLALRMTQLLQASNPWTMAQLICFCMKHRRHLFHIVEKDSIILWLRALLFPLTVVYYYRTVIPQAKDN